MPVLTGPGPRPIVLAGPEWVTTGTSRGVVHLVCGPGTRPRADAFATWLDGGCRASAPVAPGFVAVLKRPDGSVVAAVGARREVALHHCVDDGRLVLAASMRALVRALRRPPALDVGKLADLVVLHDDPHRTVYQGVQRVPVGHVAEWTAAGALATSAWFRPGEAPRLRVDPDACGALMRDAVRDAVDVSLPAGADVAATLSGGLDSSMAAGTAALLGHRVHAMTQRPVGAGYDLPHPFVADDGRDAARMADELGFASWTEFVNTERVLPVEAVRESFERSYLPVLNPANMTWLNPMVHAAARLGAPVLLTGASGNSAFSRSQHGVIAELVRAGNLRQLAVYARARRRQQYSLPVVARGLLAEGTPESLKRRVRPWLRRNEEIGAGPTLRDTMPCRRELVSVDAWHAVDARDDDHATMSRREWVDYATGDTSLSCVLQDVHPDVWFSDPLSDPAITELSLRVPPAAWIIDGRNRGLARAAAKGVVPDHVRLRETMGLQVVDVGRWLAGREATYREIIESLRASPTVGRFLDLDRVAAGLGLAFGSDVQALDWEATHGRALGFGLFALWYETHVLAPSAPLAAG